jgi:hypothetical protein
MNPDQCLESIRLWQPRPERPGIGREAALIRRPIPGLPAWAIKESIQKRFTRVHWPVRPLRVCLRALRVFASHGFLPNTPFAPAVLIAGGRQVPAVDRTMFARRLGFFAGGAAAAVDGGVAVDQLQERPAAVADTAVADPHGAPLADLRPAGPVRSDGAQAHAAELGRRGLGHRAGDRAERVGRAAKTGHGTVIGRWAGFHSLFDAGF